MPDKWAQYAAASAPQAAASTPDKWAQYAASPANPLSPQSDPSPSPYVPTASVSAQPQTVQQHISDFVSDLQNGGGHTALSKFIGRMQGRGDAGMDGLNSGVGEGAAAVIGSPALGAAHLVQGAQQLPAHPLHGAGTMLQGAGEVATIPGMIMGAPGAGAAINAVPSSARAGQTLSEIAQAAQHVPVNLNTAANPLLRAQELAQTGSQMPKVVRQLLQRATTPGEAPINFPEARDFYSNVSRLSRDEFDRLTPVMQGAMGNLRAGFHADLTQAAQSVGRGEDYANAMAEYAKAQRGKAIASALAKYGTGAAAAGALGNAMYGKAKGLLGAFSGN